MAQKNYSPKASEILDVAETHMRKGGFDAISFRDLATAVGVKSASVHYHFPAKTDLGQAVVARYRERILAALGDPTDKRTLASKLKLLFSVYTAALEQGDSVCLCAQLGAEARYLPEDVAAEVELFFSAMVGWTSDAFLQQTAPTKANKLAAHIISSLQGAMVLSVATGSNLHLKNTQNLLAEFVEAKL
ncbi:MAG: TetR/AcrR family transcriptional regulator [Kordiimonadaceae bacterium]|nr:TetR/AcrR family transcriptional regulator [Kordiimonadaceae bacterium]MBO6568167.1 TetR/AcrR family transcriptional regulator [Kordiimonadaceae bacterium]MBO6964103.1 TetR/AcrR family transcriptional regulator [Kordiimonadaceae bacterium]